MRKPESCRNHEDRDRRRQRNVTDLPAGWSPEELRELIEPVREEAQQILRRYAIGGRRAREILSRALMSMALTRGVTAERQRLYLNTIENACREERAALGPPEDQEEDQYVH